MQRVLARCSKLEPALKPIQFGDEGDLISGHKYLKGNREPRRGKGGEQLAEQIEENHRDWLKRSKGRGKADTEGLVLG